MSRHGGLETDSRHSDDTTTRPAPAKTMWDLLTAMERRQEALADHEMVLIDVRDTIKEAMALMKDQSIDVNAAMIAVHAQLKREPVPSRWQGWPLWVGAGVLAAVLLASGYGLAQLMHRQPTQAGLTTALDAVLVRHYTSLPKPVQAEVALVYAGAGKKGPGERK